MVTVALIDARNKMAGPIPRPFWTTQQIRLAGDRARRVLRNVGIPVTDLLEDGQTTLAIRRLCTDHERSLLTEPYLQ